MKFYTDKYPIPGGLHQVTVHAPWPPSPHANYFSNKKIEKQRDYNAPQALSGDTELTARAANVLNSAAKVQQNSEITKLSSKKELPPVTPLGTNRRGISKAAQTILAPRPFLSQRKINQLSCQATVAHRSRCRKQRHPATPDGNPHTRGNREVQEAKAGISLKKFSKICISHIYYIYLHQNSANYGSNSKKEFPIESVKA